MSQSHRRERAVKTHQSHRGTTTAALSRCQTRQKQQQLSSSRAARHVVAWPCEHTLCSVCFSRCNDDFSSVGMWSLATGWQTAHRKLFLMWCRFLIKSNMILGKSFGNRKQSHNALQSFKTMIKNSSKTISSVYSCLFE